MADIVRRATDEQLGALDGGKEGPCIVADRGRHPRGGQTSTIFRPCLSLPWRC